MEKGIGKLNYSYSNSTEKSYVLGQKQKTIFENGNIVYDDFSTAESIFINAQDKTIYFTKNGGKYSDSQSSMFKFIYDDNWKYSYLGMEKINGNRCHKIQLRYDMLDNDDRMISSIKNIWLNTKSGVIEKTQDIERSIYKEKIISESEYNMHTGEVTEEDVEKPNVELYDDYQKNYGENISGGHYEKTK